ncbi:MarC family protein [Acetobacter sp. AN02]|uniref:MarC family protein n=1 Tax=Acetobacter sp. AN02 TaxID=2894186 RepID=UPI002434414E|nr:MarC family protein [Acetobacter sp. AN02]MDG6093562.1 MarC family protein [Acetobacter sp. AN02]
MSESVRLLTDCVLLAFPALFSIVNPLGASLIFAQMVADRSKEDASLLARKVALYSCVLLIASVWIGNALLSFFGVSLNALRVAGGLVVAVGGWTLLHSAERVEARRQEQAMQEGRTVATTHLQDVAFFPLTMPFTVGPGAISVAIALSAGRPANAPFLYCFGITIASALVALVVWVMYTYAEKLTALLGVTGARILSRLSALILLCIGVQILAGGIGGFAEDILDHVRPAAVTAPQSAAAVQK